MSDGEVKRFSLVTDIVGGDEWTGLRRHAEGYYMSYADHERIVAELKAEIETLVKVYRSTCPECGYSGCVRGRKACDAEIDRQKETIASQKRVIEKLKTYVQHRVDCICRAGVLQYSEECDCGLEAIEKGEGT